MGSVELLAPAGDFETALAAFEAGADAVYCGLSEFSARAFAKNLTFPELRNLVSLARAKGRKVYVAFNTLLNEGDVADAVEMLSRLEEIGPDALIVQDLGVVRLCRRHFPSLRLHASTQLVAHNLEGVVALCRLGFSRVVLARELSLAEISFIVTRCGDMELECFVHGALCYSISGLCLFSAMEKGRSGNRGRCAYCCRQDFGDVRPFFPFSMKDLRLGEDARRLAEAGVASLKIEGRMKSALYVASVVRYYSQMLRGMRDGECPVTTTDLETVFSRRTTELYLNGPADDVIDPTSLGHLGADIGVVKRVTKDRDGRRWLRFHTLRALEKHDGIQFSAPDGGKPVGFGIGEMRQAISRTNVFSVAAGTDVEILLPEESGDANWDFLRQGSTVYCSMSNEIKRRFPTPSFRPSDYSGIVSLEVSVELTVNEIRATAQFGEHAVTCAAKGVFSPAKNPEKTYDAVEKAFSKLGGTDYSLGVLTLVDPEGLFAPMGTLNELRRELVAQLDAFRVDVRQAKVEAAKSDRPAPPPLTPRERPLRTLKLRLGQKIPQGAWDEIVVAISHDTRDEELASLRADGMEVRLALGVYNPDASYGRLRVLVKRLVREGFARWEASDLSTLSLLRQVGVLDITADWTLYAFNSHALEELRELGVKRFVASPENGRENVKRLAEGGYDIEFLAQQSTPLFISKTKPASETITGFSVFSRDGLWITTRPVPRTFTVPTGASSRVDLSWSET